MYWILAISGGVLSTFFILTLRETYPPTILVRKESILVNILHLRALIKADAVVLFDTYGSVDSRLHSTFLYHLQVIHYYP